MKLEKITYRQPHSINEFKVENPALEYHLKLKQHHRYFKKQISAHQNSFVFYLFLQKNRPKQFKYLKEKWENKK
jgi:hypothetical protein